MSQGHSANFTTLMINELHMQTVFNV